MDNSIATLATEDTDAAVLYAGCQQKHSTVVYLYDQLRQEMIKIKNELMPK